jgi:hypothetical protein
MTARVIPQTGWVTSSNPAPVASFSTKPGALEPVSTARRVSRTTRVEMETTIRWDAADPLAYLSTACPAEARRWTRRGYEVRVLGRYPDGEPRTWETTIPRKAVTLRSLVDGGLPMRRRQPEGRARREQLQNIEDKLRRLEEEAQEGGPTW